MKIVNERIAHRGITLTGDYINVDIKTEFTCSEGHKWDTAPCNVMGGSGCPHCAGNAKGQGGGDVRRRRGVR